jgi:hypothetical protein
VLWLATLLAGCLGSAAAECRSVVLAVVGEASTVRIEVEGEPDARARARMAFEGVKVTGLPRVSPTLSDLQRERLGGVHPVARQGPGAFCVRTTDCLATVCCTTGGELTDEYRAISPEGVAGSCRAIADCPGARRRRR